jgi:hypothetical protein
MTKTDFVKGNLWMEGTLLSILYVAVLFLFNIIEFLYYRVLIINR